MSAPGAAASLCSGSPGSIIRAGVGTPAAGIPQAPELPSGRLWNLGPGSRLPPMAFLEEHEPCSRRAEISPGCWLPGYVLSAWPQRGLEAAELPCPGPEGPPCREGSEGCLHQQGSGVPSGRGSQEPHDLDPPPAQAPCLPTLLQQPAPSSSENSNSAFLSSFHVGSLINCALNISLKLAFFFLILKTV